MAEVEKRKFSPGDFISKNQKKGSFMIYEGNNLSDTYKRMTVLCAYDPEKYIMGDIGYEQKPQMLVGSPTKTCPETVDTDQEDYWMHICTEEEKQEALKVLEVYGLAWNEETLELVDSETGELIRKVTLPDNKYHGQIIKPITEELKSLIKKCCISKIAPAYDRNYCYGEYYD